MLPNEVEQFDDVSLAIWCAIRHDEKAEFVSLMRSAFREEIRGKKKSKKMGLGKKEYCPLWILEFICRKYAMKCLTALLNGEINLDVDFNTPFDNGSYPLHYAAYELSYDMVNLFLSHGARADVRTTECKPCGLFCDNLYPLNLTLEVLCHHRYLLSWTEKQSIFKLIIVLCLPDVMVAVDICRILAQNMEKVQEAFNHYAMEGNLIEMTALLMLSREKVLAPSMSQTTNCASLVESLTLKEYFATEMMILGLFEMKLMHDRKNRNLLMTCRKKKALMTNCLLLLEVFETVGDKIEKYIQSDRSHKPNQLVAEEVKTLMEEAGFVLKKKDVDLSDICGDARERKDIMLPTQVFGNGISVTQTRNLRGSNLLPTGSFNEEKKTPVANNRKELLSEHSRVFRPYSAIRDRTRMTKIHPWRIEDDKCRRIFESRMKLMRMELMSGQKFFSVVSNIRKFLRLM